MKRIRSIYHALLIGILSASSFAIERTERIESNQSSHYIGKLAEICGVVHQVKNIKKQTYINLDGRYPNQKLAILIWNDDLNLIVDKIGRLDKFIGNRVCVKGVIDSYKGTPQINLSDPSNIQIQH